MPYCQNNISILAYSPLAQGLTGKFERGHQFDPVDNRAKNKLFQGENYERAASLRKLRPIASRHHTSSISDRLVNAQPQTQAIVGARNAQQATANTSADIQLSADELQEIDAIGRIEHLDTTRDVELEFLIS